MDNLYSTISKSTFLSSIVNTCMKMKSLAKPRQGPTTTTWKGEYRVLMDGELRFISNNSGGMYVCPIHSPLFLLTNVFCMLCYKEWMYEYHFLWSLRFARLSYPSKNSAESSIFVIVMYFVVNVTLPAGGSQTNKRSNKSTPHSQNARCGACNPSQQSLNVISCQVIVWSISFIHHGASYGWATCRTQREIVRDMIFGLCLPGGILT